MIELGQGSPACAEHYLCEGLALARQHKDQERIARFLINLANIAEQRGDHALAQTYLQEHLHLANHLARDRRYLFPMISEEKKQGKIRVFFTEVQTLIQKGNIADLEPFISVWPYADCIKEEVRALLTGSDGHLYAIPVDAYALSLVYNRRLFDEAGLHPDVPPATWEEFRQMAATLTNPRKNTFGFAMSTIHNQGRWFFTNWLYSAGARPQRQVDGLWRATFHEPAAHAFLTMLREMRFCDGSIPNKIVVDMADVADMLERRQIAMAIVLSSSVANWRAAEDGVFAELGLAPMPQNGGNACLMGGNAVVFPKHTTPEVIAVTLDGIFFRRFNPDMYEIALKNVAANGYAIGIPGVSCFKGRLQKQLMTITERYTNVPLAQYRAFIEKPLALIPESAIEAQDYSALIDPILQAVLIDPHLDPQPLLDSAAQLFEEQFLRATASD